MISELNNYRPPEQVVPTVGFLLHDVARLLRKRFDQRAKSLGLTRSQWQVLAHLAQNEGIQQGNLADILEVEAITLARMIDKLEERGWVERRRHPRDRRSWLLFLTNAARPLLAQLRAIGDAARGEALEGVEESERVQLVETLAKMKINLLRVCAQACRKPELEEAKYG